jgi:hypothetical protein
VKGWKKAYQTNELQDQSGVTIFISDKGHFRPRLVRRDNEGHYTEIKGTIHQDEVIILNIDAPNLCTHNYFKKIKPLLNLKAQVDYNTIIVGDFNTPLSQ